MRHKIRFVRSNRNAPTVHIGLRFNSTTSKRSQNQETRKPSESTHDETYRRTVQRGGGGDGRGGRTCRSCDREEGPETRRERPVVETEKPWTGEAETGSEGERRRDRGATFRSGWAGEISLLWALWAASRRVVCAIAISKYRRVQTRTLPIALFYMCERSRPYPILDNNQNMYVS